MHISNRSCQENAVAGFHLGYMVDFFLSAKEK